MPVLSKHAVLCGEIDFVCLSCEKTFRSAEDAESHVKTDSHSTSFQTTGYTEKYADEFIRKIKQWYLCEVCNCVIASSRRIAEHVGDEEHEFNKTSGDVAKGRGHLKRIGNQIMAFDEIVISGESWNGIIEESCVVCDVDWDDIEEHVTDVKHVINLVQVKVNSGSGTLFRKIDNTQCHCLTCNAVLPKDKLLEHWDSKEHIKLQIQCRKAKRDLDERKKTEENQGGGEIKETAKTDSKELKHENDEKVENLIQDTDKQRDEKPVINDKTDESQKKSDTNESSPKEETVDNENKELKSDKVAEQNESCKAASSKENKKKAKLSTYELNLWKSTFNTKTNKDNAAAATGKEQQLVPAVPTAKKNETIPVAQKEELTKARTEVQPKATKETNKPINNSKKEVIYDVPVITTKNPTIPVAVKEKIIKDITDNKPKKTEEKNEKSTKIEEKPQKESKTEDQNLFLYKTADKELLLKDYIAKNENNYTCVLCRWDLTQEQIEDHLDTENHKILVRLHRNDVRALNEQVTDNMYLNKPTPDPKPAEVKEEKLVDAELMEFYKNNHIKVYDKFVVCKACDVEIGYVKKCIIQHINGARHKRNAESVCDDSNEVDLVLDGLNVDSKVPMARFTVIFYQYGINCLVNETFCVSVFSYCLVVPKKCLICNFDLGEDIQEFLIHVNSYEHRVKQASVPVLTGIPGEFVRELGPSKFHCGVCDFVVEGKVELSRHLRSEHHGEMAITRGHIRREYCGERRNCVNDETMRFIRKVNDSLGKTYF